MNKIKKITQSLLLPKKEIKSEHLFYKEKKLKTFFRQPQKNSKQVSWKLKLNHSLAEILRFFSVAMSSIYVKNISICECVWKYGSRHE